MIKREFKVNFKNFVIWLSILLGMFLLVYLIYPYIITEETMKQLDDMMKVFPQEVLKAFNMDVSSISTAYGWFKTEGFTFVLLVIGFYASMLGGNILLKEESNKTIEYLNSLPITRKKIVTNKIIVGITYILSIVLILGIFNYIALLISGDFNQKEFLFLSLSPIFIALPLFGLNLFISTFMHKTKGVVGISLGLVFVFYILNVLSELYLFKFVLFTVNNKSSVSSSYTSIFPSSDINPLKLLK